MNYTLMNTDMTKAILDGRKVQTRRVIKFGLYAIPNDMNEHCIEVASNYCDLDENNNPELKSEMIKHAKYQKDEVIWVREPAIIAEYDMRYEIFTEVYNAKYMYLADRKTGNVEIVKAKGKAKKWLTNCQGIPNGCIKEMARIFLKVTDVRVERLQDMTEHDMGSEGIRRIVENKPLMYATQLLEELEPQWINLWNSTAPKGYKWEDNPYVFVYEFKKIETEAEINSVTVDENTKIDYASKPFKTLQEQQPEKDGYYYVIWEDGDLAKKVYLWDCREICSDDGEPLWSWGFSKNDDPESVTIDIKDAWDIRWCSVDEFEGVEK